MACAQSVGHYNNVQRQLYAYRSINRAAGGPGSTVMRFIKAADFKGEAALLAIFLASLLLAIFTAIRFSRTGSG